MPQFTPAELLTAAREAVKPEWVTHVAISRDMQTIEPACYDALCDQYFDQADNLFFNCPRDNGELPGMHESAHWTFYSQEELSV